MDWADLHRWKMINKTLDLPFDEPQETYSTSEHLFHDQGIPPGTKGRIKDPEPVEAKPRADRGDRGDRRDRGERSGRGDKPSSNRPDRDRSRTRGGRPVADVTAGAVAAPPAAEAGDAEERPARNRNRRRRRRSGGESGQQPAAETA